MSTEAVVGLVITILTGFFGGLAALVRWGLSQWRESSVENRMMQGRTIDALVGNTASNATLTGKLDQLLVSNADLSRKIDGIGDFVQEHTPVHQPIPRRTPAYGLPAGQYSQTKPRGSTNDGR